MLRQLVSFCLLAKPHQSSVLISVFYVTHYLHFFTLVFVSNSLSNQISWYRSASARAAVCRFLHDGSSGSQSRVCNPAKGESIEWAIITLGVGLCTVSFSYSHTLSLNCHSGQLELRIKNPEDDNDDRSQESSAPWLWVLWPLETSAALASAAAEESSHWGHSSLQPPWPWSLGGVNIGCESPGVLTQPRRIGRREKPICDKEASSWCRWRSWGPDSSCLRMEQLLQAAATAAVKYHLAREWNWWWYCTQKRRGHGCHWQS